MSSAPVILQTGLNDQLQRLELNKTITNEKAEGNGTFFKEKHKHDNPVTSLGCSYIHKFIICVATLINRLSCSKVLEVEGFVHQRKTSGFFNSH